MDCEEKLNKVAKVLVWVAEALEHLNLSLIDESIVRDVLVDSGYTSDEIQTILTEVITNGE